MNAEDAFWKEASGHFSGGVTANNEGLGAIEKVAPGRWTAERAAELIRKVGGTEEEARMLGAIAMPESKGDPFAHNPKYPDDSYGLWQINMLGAMGPERLKQFGLSRKEDLFNPETNARVALALARSDRGYNHWSTYQAGKHKPWLGSDALAYAAKKAPQVSGGVTTGAPPQDDDISWMEEASPEIFGKQPQQEEAPTWMDETMPPPEQQEPDWEQFPQALPPPTNKLPDWGFPQAFAHGLTLGYGPEVGAGLNTAYDYLTGQSFPGDYETRLGRIKEARERYGQEHTTAAPLGELAGSVYTTALASELGANPLLGAAFKGAGLPSLATAITEGGGVLGRAIQGAYQGLLGTALTRNLQPESKDESLPSQLGIGAGVGAVTNALVSPLITKAAAPFMAQIEPGMKQLADTAAKKFGITLWPGQLGHKEMQKLEKQLVDPAHMQKQVEQFTSELAKRIGLPGGKLDGAAWQQAKDAIQQEYDRLAGATSVIGTPALRNTINGMRTYGAQYLLDSEKKILNQVLDKVEKRFSRGYLVTGKEVQQFTRTDGLIDSKLIKTPGLERLGKDLRKTLMDMVEVQNPTEAGAWRRANELWKNLKITENSAKTARNGVVDPHKLEAGVNSRKVYSGDMKELADIGKLLPKIDASGKVPEQAAQKGFKVSAEGIVETLGAGGGAAYLAQHHLWPTIQALTPEVINALTGGPGLLAAGGVAAGHYLARKGQEHVLNNPKLVRAAVQKTGLPAFLGGTLAPEAANALVRGASGFATQTGTRK